MPVYFNGIVTYKENQLVDEQFNEFGTLLFRRLANEGLPNYWSHQSAGQQNLIELQK